MARITRATRRADLRATIRSGRPKRGTAPRKPASPAAEPAEIDDRHVRRQRTRQRKRIRAARAMVRLSGRRAGFGKALRGELRAGQRASVQRARKRLLPDFRLWMVAASA